MNRTLHKGIYLRKYQLSQLSENFNTFLNLYTYPNCCEQYLGNNSGKFQYFLYNLNDCDTHANKNLVNIFLAQFIGELYWSNNSDKTRQSVKSLCERAPNLNPMEVEGVHQLAILASAHVMSQAPLTCDNCKGLQMAIPWQTKSWCLRVIASQEHWDGNI